MVSTWTPDAVVEEFGDRLARQDYAKFVAVELSAGLMGDPVSLDLITTCPDQRGQGHADAALKLLTDLCDEARIDIELTASPRDSSTDRARLEAGYARRGFAHVPGDGSLMRRRFRDLP